METAYLLKKKLPDEPGVYFFLAKEKILYIGKATSLRNRVKSYFVANLMVTRSSLIADMVVLADEVTFIKTDSALEALILEAELIKKHQPHYNTKEKDNKSFNFVVITKEKYPKLITIRGRDLEHQKISGEVKVKYQFGPFSNGESLRQALKIIRRILPYRDHKCMALSGKPCFNYQIGLCPGPCVGAVSLQEYAKIIRHIVLFFRGNKPELIRVLKKEMKEYSKVLKFEEAARVKKQIFSLQHIRDVSLMAPEFQQVDGTQIPGTPENVAFRIEAYDVAHLQGSSMTGVMVVVEDGLTKKSDYRMFKIKRQGINDVASLDEILTRRLVHDEWPMPQLIVVDGGVAQLNRAQEVLTKKGISIPLVAVVKDEKHRPREILGTFDQVEEHKKAILLANSEAHRFTLKYHRIRRSKDMFDSI